SRARPTGLPRNSRGEPLLLRRFGRFGRGAGFAVAGIRRVGVFVIDVGVAFHYATHAGQAAAVIDADQRHALGRAPHFADFTDAGTHQHATRSDEHDFVGRPHQHGADHLAVARGGLDGDHALGAA